MRPTRLISTSVAKNLSDLFGVPGSVMGIPWNVYGESTLRAGQAPTWPYVYILDFGVVFGIEHLPTILVQCSTSRITAELGSLGFHTNLGLHIFARDRGQRQEISGAIMETVECINLYGDSGAQIAVASLIGDAQTGRLWYEEYTNIAATIAVEGSLANWVTLVSSFETYL